MPPPRSPTPTLADLEALAAAADPVIGLYGPKTISWQIYREHACLLGGGRALLLQLAHPAVAQGVADHSGYREDPLGRSQRTFEVMYAIAFGDRETALRAGQRMRARHRGVEGALAEGRYDARDPALLLWVVATLIDTAAACYQRFVGPLPDATLERFYAEQRPRFALYGLDPARTPATWAEFRGYFDAMVAGATLEVGEVARAITRSVFGLAPSDYLQGILARERGAGLALLDHWPLRGLTLDAVGVLTAGMLPPRLREGYGDTLPSGRLAALRYRSLLATLTATYRTLPRSLRFVRQYLDACARLEAAGVSIG